MEIIFLPSGIPEDYDNEYLGGTFALPEPEQPIPPMPEIPEPQQVPEDPIPPMPNFGEEEEGMPPMPTPPDPLGDDASETDEEASRDIDRDVEIETLNAKVVALEQMIDSVLNERRVPYTNIGKLDDSNQMPGMPFDEYLSGYDYETENNHSFHFSSTGADAGTVTDGFYRIGDGSGVEITPATISDTTTRYYWVKVVWSNYGAAPVVTWENNGTGFPTTVADTWIYPILEFDADGVCIEHRQTDIQLPATYQNTYAFTGENAHSFHFAPTSATVGDMSDGLFYYQGEKQTIAEASAAITGTGPWELTISASHYRFYLEVDDTSVTPTFTLKSGTSFPDADSQTRIFPILEFDSAGNNTLTCIEHQQSDLHLDVPPHKTTGDDYNVLQINADGAIVWDVPRFNAEAPL